MLIVSCIVAVAENGVIGRSGGLPWRLPSDLKRFRKLTMGHPLIMGRVTFETIGRALPGRDNIVVTSDTARIPRLPGVLPATSLEEAFSYGRSCAEARGVSEIFIIGGSVLFDQAMPWTSRIYLTRVHAEPEGDVRWTPPAEGPEWREVSRLRREPEPGDEFPVTDIVLERAENAPPPRTLPQN